MFYICLQDCGVPFVVDGAIQHFRGTITIVSADNPSSTLLGGFKQSASAFRCCRHCMGIEEDIQSKVMYMCTMHVYVYTYRNTKQWHVHVGCIVKCEYSHPHVHV